MHKKNLISWALHDEIRTKRKSLHKVKSEVWKLKGVSICDGVNWLWNDDVKQTQISKIDTLKIKMLKQPYTYSQRSVFGLQLNKIKLPDEYIASNIDEEIQKISENDPKFEKYFEDPFIQKQFSSQIKTLEIVKNKSNNSEVFDLKCRQKELERLQDVYIGIVESMKVDPVVIAKWVQLK